uniref:Ovule protein n=1 Tax=Parascaris equorum TaxID=6256 RepID=A0A914RB76_PAREQ
MSNFNEVGIFSVELNLSPHFHHSSLLKKTLQGSLAAVVTSILWSHLVSFHTELRSYRSSNQFSRNMNYII